jgi:hypothetical protein
MQEEHIGTKTPPALENTRLLRENLLPINQLLKT